MTQFKKYASGLIFTAALCALYAAPPSDKSWMLVFSDDFDYPDANLDDAWIAQNGTNSHILCSRWRENATVENGILKLNNKKETRAGQNWTSASIWTKRKFLYGYYECRYRYAAETGVNNSFWLISTGTIPAGQERYEIDINEGHYPNELNITNHYWSRQTTNADGTKTHPAVSHSYCIGENPNPGNTHELGNIVRAQKLRFESKNMSHFHLRELRVFGYNSTGYPNPYDNAYASKFPTLTNYAAGAAITAFSGLYSDEAIHAVANALDDNLNTSWVTQIGGEKFLEIDLGEPRDIACIQAFTGWKSGSEWVYYIDDYRILYWSDASNAWVPIPEPARIHELYKPVTAQKIRLRSPHPSHFHVREFKIFGTSDVGYPSVYLNDFSAAYPGLTNYALNAQTSVSGSYNATDLYKPANAIDGNAGTSWCSQQGTSEKIFEITLPQATEIGCIELATGWMNAGVWSYYISDYVLEYFNEDLQTWKILARRSSQYPRPATNLSESFHTYGFEWTDTELTFYFDGEVVDKRANDICQSSAPVYLSAAIAEFAGAVTDAIDGTSMDVDWVKIYEIDDGSGVQSYAAWAQSVGLAGADALPAAVTGGEENNLSRYVFKLEAGQSAAQGGAFSISRSGGVLTLGYRLAKYAENVAVSVELSTDLKTWTASSASAQKILSDGYYDYYKVETPDTYGASTPIFARIKLAEILQ